MRLSWPILASNVAVILYQVSNTLWLGRTGSDAVAVMAMAFPVLGFLWAVGDGIVMGGSALVARYTGSGDGESVNRVTAHVAALVFLYYVMVAVAVLPFMGWLLALIGTPSGIVKDVLGFIRILVLAMPLTELFYVYTSMLQGTGDTVTPMKMWSVTMMANMVLDPFLIIGYAAFPGMGVRGAALAIVACRLALALFAVVGAVRGRHGVQVGMRHLRPDRRLLARLLRVSLPIGGERMLLGVENLVLVSIVAGFGAPVLAAYGVGQRILSLVTMPGFAAGTAVTSLVGQNLGARKMERAERATWVTGLLVFAALSAAGAAMALFAGSMFSLFSTDGEVIRQGIRYLQVVGPSVGFMGVFLVTGGACRALERSLPYLGWVLASSWLLKIPLAIILPWTLGVSGIWLALAVTSVLSSVTAWTWLKCRCWRKLLVGSMPRQPLTNP